VDGSGDEISKNNFFFPLVNTPLDAANQSTSSVMIHPRVVAGLARVIHDDLGGFGSARFRRQCLNCRLILWGGLLRCFEDFVFSQPTWFNIAWKLWARGFVNECLACGMDVGDEDGTGEADCFFVVVRFEGEGRLLVLF
jgi:hypothetical protein